MPNPSAAEYLGERGPGSLSLLSHKQWIHNQAKPFDAHHFSSFLTGPGGGGSFRRAKRVLLLGRTCLQMACPSSDGAISRDLRPPPRPFPESRNHARSWFRGIAQDSSLLLPFTHTSILKCLLDYFAVLIDAQMKKLPNYLILLAN